MSNLESLVSDFVNSLKEAGFVAGQSGDVSAPLPPPITYEQSGWSITARSAHGAPRSKRVDELVRELNSKGYQKIAAEIPTYHCIAYWLTAQFPETAWVNLSKVKEVVNNFGVFAPVLDDDDEQTLSDNIVHAVQQMGSFSFAANRDLVKTEYRGQVGKHGFVRVVADGDAWQPDFSPSLAPNYQALVNSGSIDRPGNYAFELYKRRYDPYGYSADPIKGSALADHYVYNIWWDGRTDENVGRFWRNWAVAVGANIPLD